MVVFDERSSLGLVRLRVKKAGAQLARVFEEIQKKSEHGQARRRHAVRRDHGRGHRQPVFGLNAPNMSFINYSSREINCKIVYYGPGLCGKTTNLQYIYNKTNPDLKGKMISLATETERTLFFDFLPLALGQIRGFKTRFHLYTVPGQVFYDASRKLILKGVDGVVFVADSQVERMEANIESLDNLRQNLGEQGYDLDKISCVVQYNKRDLPNARRPRRDEAAAQPEGDARLRGLRTPGQGRVRDTEGRRPRRAARSQADEPLARARGAASRPGRTRASPLSTLRRR